MWWLLTSRGARDGGGEAYCVRLASTGVAVEEPRMVYMGMGVVDCRPCSVFP